MFSHTHSDRPENKKLSTESGNPKSRRIKYPSEEKDFVSFSQVKIKFITNQFI